MSFLNKSSLAALALVGSLGFGVSGAAHAGVMWSVAVGQPGFAVGVSSAPVVMPAYYPAPVYPAPVMVAPRPVFMPPPPAYMPPRVVYAPPRVAYAPYVPTAYPMVRGWEHYHPGYYRGPEYHGHGGFAPHGGGYGPAPHGPGGGGYMGGPAGHMGR